jgi:hypothetical protein
MDIALDAIWETYGCKSKNPSISEEGSTCHSNDIKRVDGSGSFRQSAKV